MELGGNIELVGFSGQDPGDLIVVKKIVGNFAKSLSEEISGFSELVVTLQEVHRTGKATSFDVVSQAKGDFGEEEGASSDGNLYFALDASLKALEAALKK